MNTEGWLEEIIAVLLLKSVFTYEVSPKRNFWGWFGQSGAGCDAHIRKDFTCLDVHLSKIIIPFMGFSGPTHIKFIIFFGERVLCFIYVT